MGSTGCARTEEGWFLSVCVDCQKLNDVTKRDIYLISRMDKCINSLCKSGVFSTLNASNWYWHVEIRNEDRDKPSFTSHHGLYRFVLMPFGISTALSTFQRAMDVAFLAAKSQFEQMYLDDIVVFSPSTAERVNNFERGLVFSSESEATLKLKKCNFYTETIDYLG